MFFISLSRDKDQRVLEMTLLFTRKADAKGQFTLESVWMP
jgi:hypothetical protein